jgi:hypothetical protein
MRGTDGSAHSTYNLHNHCIALTESAGTGAAAMSDLSATYKLVARASEVCSATTSTLCSHSKQACTHDVVSVCVTSAQCSF